MQLLLNQKPLNLLDLKQHFFNGGLIEKFSLKELLLQTMDILRNEDNVIDITDNATIFGDYHGQYYDFIKQTEDSSQIFKEQTLIYLGDYVDRGEMSCEILITLCCMKLNDPKRVILLRGNHECIRMTSRMGFKWECTDKYDNDVYNLFCEFFNCLPLCVLLHTSYGSMFLSHAGISPDLVCINDIQHINRFCEPTNGLLYDLLWSDPLDEDLCSDDINSFQNTLFSPNTIRKCSYFYGRKAVVNFLFNNNLVCIIRAHQCVADGIGLHFLDSLQQLPLVFTVFGAPNYTKKNQGGVLFINNNGILSSRYSTTKPRHQQFVTSSRINYSIEKLSLNKMNGTSNQIDIIYQQSHIILSSELIKQFCIKGTLSTKRKSMIS
ncbi:Serine/threonine-protein phosphatase [Entamoeba marina]